MIELLQLQKIKVHFISPNHPQSNGQIERLHSTLTEHIRLLNAQGFQSTPVKNKIIYAINAYNHSIHSATKYKPTDIINGHTSSNDPFDLEIEKLLINDYVIEHKEKSKLLYSKINSDLIQRKERVIQIVNKKCDQPDIFAIPQKVFLKKQIRQKHTNKFTKSTPLQTVNPERKTISTETQNKVHMSNIKRPLRKTFSFD